VRGSFLDLLRPRRTPGKPAAEVLVRREVSAAGRSRAFIDGTLATAGALKALAAELVELHGQHEHQTLLDPSTHIDLVDAYGALQDAAANTARALALLHGLAAGRVDLLDDALQDVYHVPYRARLIPAFERAVEAGTRAGAFGVTISGSGPTLLALHAPGPTAGVRVGAAMIREFARAGVHARAIPGLIAARGAVSRTLG